jgi:hypothetical protein
MNTVPCYSRLAHLAEVRNAVRDINRGWKPNADAADLLWRWNDLRSDAVGNEHNHEILLILLHAAAARLYRETRGGSREGGAK